MSTIKDGGPAFPCLERGGNGLDLAHAGITLRDYFAANFMVCAQSLCEYRGGWSMENAAQCAYDMADAMLTAREKGGA